MENDILTEAIVRQLNTCDENVEVRYNSRVKEYKMPVKVLSGQSPTSEQSHLVEVILEDGERIRTKLLV